jgi:hypothetical protein
MKRILLMLAAAGAAFAQGTSAPRYIAYDSQSLTASGETLTVQQPGIGAKQVTFETASAYCSVACTITLAQNGSAATGSTTTPASINPITVSATALEYKGSNVGSGTTLGTWVLGAGAFQSIDLSKISLGATGTGTNLSLSVSSITGTATLTIIWNER